MWKHVFVEQLIAARNGGKQKVIDKYRAMTGKTAQSLYRIAAKNGFNAGRKKRLDKGACELNDMQISFIAAQIQVTSRELKGPIMPVEKALIIAEDNGIVEPGAVSVSRMQSILAERQINKAAMKTPRPHIKMRSLHPNHVHIYDMSVCIQYYLKGKKGLRMMREDMFYKNKFENFAKVKRKLIRYVLVDHFSHFIYVKYYYTGGETQENLYDFLLSAWSGDKHPKIPFRGVPFYALFDKGAANVSKAITTFLNRLDIKTPDSLPHNPRRQGSAEVAQNLVECWFESGLRMQPAHSVEDLNAWAIDWCAWFNGTRKHSRHKMPRTECWLGIKKEQLRELPERQILHYLYEKPGENRLVRGDYTISFCYKNHDVREYNVKHIEGIQPNRSRVQVLLRPHNWPEVGVVHDQIEYLVKPIGYAEGGFRADAAIIGEEFKSMPETKTQKAAKISDNLAYGEDRKKDAVPFEGMQVYGNQADKVTLEYMPKTGVEISTSQSGFEDREISVMELLQKLLASGIGITPELNKAIKDTYGKTILLAESKRLLDIGAGTGKLIPANLGGNSDAALKTVAS
ncbi:MAG: hypothetical protein JRC90_11085 [Deltaproteobacteria bacterium]|nr:hypothetical protein [Deltaproteobacteria bacterium]